MTMSLFNFILCLIKKVFHILSTMDQIYMFGLYLCGLLYSAKIAYKNDVEQRKTSEERMEKRFNCIYIIELKKNFKERERGIEKMDLCLENRGC